MGKEDRYDLKNNPISDLKIGLDTHSFNVSLASRFGIVEALIIQHSYYWYKCNKGNEDMTKDGHTWFYRSVSQIADVYPYLSVDKVRRAIDRLVENGILIKGNYNTDKFKKANWYSLSDDIISAMSGDNESGDRQNAKPFGKMPNHSAKCQLNYNKEDNNNEYKEEKDKSFSKKSYDLSFVDKEYMSTFTEWLEYKAERKEKYKTESSLKACYNRLLKLSGNNPKIAEEIVQQSIANNYAGLFEYKEMRAQKPKPKTQEEINREKLNMPILNDDGDLPDGTFFKNGKRWYFSKQEGRAVSCAPDASPRPNDRAEYDWAIKDWRVPRDKWEASDEIW